MQSRASCVEGKVFAIREHLNRATFARPTGIMVQKVLLADCFLEGFEVSRSQTQQATSLGECCGNMSQYVTPTHFNITCQSTEFVGIKPSHQRHGSLGNLAFGAMAFFAIVPHLPRFRVQGLNFRYRRRSFFASQRELSQML